MKQILEDKESNSKKQSKKQKKMAAAKEKTCPLCLEPFDLEDINFYPCKCGYQVCRFCWHRIRVTENCLCPQCRRQYPEDPVTFKPLTQEEMTKLKTEKKLKEIQKKKENAENRKQLANIRIVQKNLVYVHGLPQEVETDEELSRKVQQIFREFGPVLKCVINTKTNYVGSQVPRASAYVTYQKMEDALRAYKKLPSLKFEAHEIKTSLGTTKYCSNFLKGVFCPKADCMYLHEVAEEELCFTKEQIQTGQHINVGSILYDRMMAQSIQRSNQVNQIKEPVIEEQNVEPENVNSEKVNSKEDSSESELSEPSQSPKQSRYQHIFTNSETQNSIFASGYEGHYNVQVASSPVEEGLRTGSLRDELLKSLSDAPSVNNSPVLNTKKLPMLPMDSLQQYSVDLQHAITPQTNHVHKSFSSDDIDVLNSKNSVRFPVGHPSPFINNGTSSSLAENLEHLQLEDCDLGFDPCQYSLDALREITASEERSVSRANAVARNVFNSNPKQPSPFVNNHVLQQLKNLQPQNFLPRQRNPPPPGFAANTFSSSPQQLPSPSFEPRNLASNRMSPVINLSNFNGIRPNFPFQRYQSLSNSSVANGFSPQPIRTVPSAQTFHDFASRSAPTSQHMPSQRLENMPLMQQQQHFNTQEQNLSPSFMNVNQTQWMPYENFQSPTLPKYRPASPQNFAIPQQLRPEEIQRLQYPRLNNLTFTDNSQYGFSANQNQIKGVNTFP